MIRVGVADGTFRSDVDPKTASIFLLSVLNALERWYHPDGELDRDALVGELTAFAVAALS